MLMRYWLEKQGKNGGKKTTKEFWRKKDKLKEELSIAIGF